VSEPALEVGGVWKSYGSLVVLSGVSLAVGDGEAVGVVGPNGAGKTTLLDLLTGTARCDAGHIRLLGADVTRLPPPLRARKGLGRTFQVPRPLGAMTVFENALVGARRAARLRGQHAYHAAYAALVMTDMARLANRQASSLRVNAAGTAIVWVEHVIRVLAAVAGRLVCLADGIVIADGPPAEVLASEVVQSAYLGGSVL